MENPAYIQNISTLLKPVVTPTMKATKSVSDVIVTLTADFARVELIKEAISAFESSRDCSFLR